MVAVLMGWRRISTRGDMTDEYNLATDWNRNPVKSLSIFGAFGD